MRTNKTYDLMMCLKTILFLLLVSSTHSQLFDFNKLRSYVKIFNINDLYVNDTSNVLWHGLFKDCAKKASFSCIQKNVYTYLDDTFTDRDNITVFDGFVMTKNNLDYHKYSAEYNEKKVSNEQNDIDESHVDDDHESTIEKEDEADNSRTTNEKTRNIEDNYVEPLSPLEEVTTALHDKAIKFLATRNYEVQLPNFFFEGTSIKLSPKEIDEDGALIRIDFKQKAISTEGRFFKKIKKFIQNKLVTSFLALLLIIKLIKIKFMFIIPFLFGVGTAKKLFLKILLFLIPAFAHVFKLCSSYYSSGTKYHHHHHQIAHHHHHVPVPVPVPSYHHDHHPHHHETEEFDGYDYTQPHIQYRKDMEELKEWGIEPDADIGVINQGPYAHVEPAYGPYGMPQYAANARPVTVVPNHLGPFEKYVPQIKYDKPLGPFENPNPNIRHTLNNIGMTQFNKNIGPKIAVANLGPIANHAQSLAYNGYIDDVRYTRAAASVTEATLGKGPYRAQQQHLFTSQIRPGPTSSKNSVFASKSDSTDRWLSGSTIGENVLRTQHSVQQTVKSPVFVQNSQLGNPSSQNFGQAGVNAIQQGQTVSAAAQNVIKPFQHPSNALPNSQQALQHALPLNPSSTIQKSTYNPHASAQGLHKQTSGPTTGVETVKKDLPIKHLDASNSRVRLYDDEFYGPILSRLEEIFRQLRFVDEECRDRLVCSMYKNPTIYTPHSNLVSNELSREPEELRQGNRESESGRRFQRYLNAARSGQDGGDCSRLYACHISTE